MSQTFSRRVSLAYPLAADRAAQARRFGRAASRLSGSLRRAYFCAIAFRMADARTPLDTLKLHRRGLGIDDDVARDETILNWMKQKPVDEKAGTKGW